MNYRRTFLLLFVFTVLCAESGAQQMRSLSPGDRPRRAERADRGVR